MGTSLTTLPSSPPFTAFRTAEQRAPPCPFCESEDTVVIGHNGVLGAITLCRCNTCRTEWPETILDDGKK
jgi:hypothetical protein